MTPYNHTLSLPMGPLEEKSMNVIVNESLYIAWLLELPLSKKKCLNINIGMQECEGICPSLSEWVTSYSSLGAQVMYIEMGDERKDATKDMSKLVYAAKFNCCRLKIFS